MTRPALFYWRWLGGTGASARSCRIIFQDGFQRGDTYDAYSVGLFYEDENWIKEGEEAGEYPYAPANQSGFYILDHKMYFGSILYSLGPYEASYTSPAFLKFKTPLVPPYVIVLPFDRSSGPLDYSWWSRGRICLNYQDPWNYTYVDFGTIPGVRFGEVVNGYDSGQNYDYVHSFHGVGTGYPGTGTSLHICVTRDGVIGSVKTRTSGSQWETDLAGSFAFSWELTYHKQMVSNYIAIGPYGGSWTDTMTPSHVYGLGRQWYYMLDLPSITIIDHGSTSRLSCPVCVAKNPGCFRGFAPPYLMVTIPEPSGGLYPCNDCSVYAGEHKLHAVVGVGGLPLWVKYLGQVCDFPAVDPYNATTGTWDEQSSESSSSRSSSSSLSSSSDFSASSISSSWSSSSQSSSSISTSVSWSSQSSVSSESSQSGSISGSTSSTSTSSESSHSSSSTSLSSSSSASGSLYGWDLYYGPDCRWYWNYPSGPWVRLDHSPCTECDPPTRDGISSQEVLYTPCRPPPYYDSYLIAYFYGSYIYVQIVVARRYEYGRTTYPGQRCPPSGNYGTYFFSESLATYPGASWMGWWNGVNLAVWRATPAAMADCSEWDFDADIYLIPPPTSVYSPCDFTDTTVHVESLGFRLPDVDCCWIWSDGVGWTQQTDPCDEGVECAEPGWTGRDGEVVLTRCYDMEQSSSSSISTSSVSSSSESSISTSSSSISTSSVSSESSSLSSVSTSSHSHSSDISSGSSWSSDIFSSWSSQSPTSESSVSASSQSSQSSTSPSSESSLSSQSSTSPSSQSSQSSQSSTSPSSQSSQSSLSSQSSISTSSMSSSQSGECTGECIFMFSGGSWSVVENSCVGYDCNCVDSDCMDFPEVSEGQCVGVPCVRSEKLSCYQCNEVSPGNYGWQWITGCGGWGPCPEPDLNDELRTCTVANVTEKVCLLWDATYPPCIELAVGITPCPTKSRVSSSSFSDVTLHGKKRLVGEKRKVTILSPERQAKIRKFLENSAENARIAADLLEDPSMVEMATHYAIALGKWAKSGFKVRTPEEVGRVVDICQNGCGFYDPEKSVCKVCGCSVSMSGTAVKNKAKMATEHCPKGKW